MRYDAAHKLKPDHGGLVSSYAPGGRESLNENGFVQVLRRWWRILLLSAAIGGVVANLIAQALTPTYRAASRELVGPVNASGPTIVAAGSLGRTYAELATSGPVLDDALERSGQTGDPDELVEEGHVAATANQISRLVTIEVERDNPEAAADLANAVATVLVERSREAPVEQTEALQELRTSRELSRLTARARADVIEAAERTLGEAMVGRLQIVDPARPPREPVWPQVWLLTGMGALAGLLLAATVVFLRGPSSGGPAEGRGPRAAAAHGGDAAGKGSTTPASTRSEAGAGSSDAAHPGPARPTGEPAAGERMRAQSR